MLSTLKKNAIIAGNISSYCLVCEQYLECVDDTAAHVEESTHTEELLAHAYLEKYGDNHIRKVNTGYFCEFCSLIFSTATQVSLHIQEKTHYDNKGASLLRWSHGAVIAFDDVLISEKAWHGLAEDTCAICNVEFDDESIHKSESRHQLNLVQVTIEFGANNNVYRKTDVTSFQCLTCNNAFVLKKINEHFDDPEHKNLYTKCQEAMKRIEATKLSEKSTKSKPNDQKTKNEAKYVDGQNDVTLMAISSNEAKLQHPIKKHEATKPSENLPEPESKNTDENNKNEQKDVNHNDVTLKVISSDEPKFLDPIKEHEATKPSEKLPESKITDEKNKNERKDVNQNDVTLKAISSDEPKFLDPIKEHEATKPSEKLPESKIADEKNKNEQKDVNQNNVTLNANSSDEAKYQKARKKHEATKPSGINTTPETIDPHNDNEKKDFEEHRNVVAVKSNSKDEAKQEADLVNTNECRALVLRSTETNQPSSDDETTTYANDNNITYNSDNTNAYCRVCERRLPATLRSMKEHVVGKEHKNKLGRAKASARPKREAFLTKHSMDSFIDIYTRIEGLFYHDVIVNHKYCMPVWSFAMITQSETRYRCQACEVSFEDVTLHCNSLKHKKAMKETPVITSLSNSEFVREVRPEVFHCGYCNLVAPRWEQLTAHMQSISHRYHKRQCEWRLQLHMPKIIQHRRQREMSFLHMVYATLFRD